MIAAHRRARARPTSRSPRIALAAAEGGRRDDDAELVHEVRVETLRALPELAREAQDPAEGVAEAVRRGAEPLTGALALLFGIDPIVALADNSDIPRERIPDVLAWAARGVVEAVLAEA